MQEKKGKWSEWFSNEGNTKDETPDTNIKPDTLVQVIFRSGDKYSGTISQYGWSTHNASRPVILYYRYWIPEDESAPETTQTQDSEKKHSHYFKDVSNLDYIDVYRVIDLFKIEHPCLQHAVKKLLVSGGRGHKDEDRDIQDVIDSCVRWQEMRKEDKE
jgi:hypothetical protein